MTFHVLGCGPAGLMAAHAGVLLGYDVQIHSKRRKSEMYGAQYLHKEIPDIDCGEPFEVTYTLHGDEKGYREKVYGPKWQGTVSPEDLTESHQGWDIRRAYDDLWKKYNGLIINTDLDSVIIDNMLREDPNGIYCSSIPATVLCGSPEIHAFTGQEIWAIGDAPERGLFCPVSVANENEVVCNGEPSPAWYRASNILGYRTAEWSGRKPPFDGISQVIKPLSTTCNCLPRVNRVGRYGKWQKGVLSHEAFDEAFEGLRRVDAE